MPASKPAPAPVKRSRKSQGRGEPPFAIGQTGRRHRRRNRPRRPRRGQPRRRLLHGPRQRSRLRGPPPRARRRQSPRRAPPPAQRQSPAAARAAPAEADKEALESSILAAIAQAVDVLVEDSGTAPPGEETGADRHARAEARTRPSEGGESDDIGDEIQRIIASYSRARQQGGT